MKKGIYSISTSHTHKSGSYIDHVWTHTDAYDIWNLNLLTVTKQIFSDITVHIN